MINAIKELKDWTEKSFQNLTQRDDEIERKIQSLRCVSDQYLP